MTNLLKYKLHILVIFMLFAYNSSSACIITAHFETSNSNPVMGDHVTFTNTSKNATVFEWQIDGFTVSTDSDYTHYFNGAGVFNVKLVATDGRSCISEYKEVFDIRRIPKVFDDRIPSTYDTIKVYDRFGNEFTIDDIRIPNNSWNAGIFVLHFDDEDFANGAGNNVGFDDPNPGPFTTLGQDRREVIIQVFEDLSALLTNGLPTPYTWPNNLSTQVEILISTDVGPNAVNLPAGVLGQGSSYYYGSPNTGIDYGLTWQTITTGVVPSYGTNFLGSPFSYYHGKLSLSMLPTTNWYLNLSGNSPIGATQRDLYSAALHEAMHMLGFASGIDQNGSSILNSGNYLLYDTFLANNGVSLLSSSTNCYDIQNTGSSYFTGGCNNSNSINFMGNGANNANHAVHTPSSWDVGSSLSHFNCNSSASCVLAGNGYAMNHCTEAGVNSIQRIPHISEIETLYDLGYDIQSNYGNGDYTASTTTGNPYTFSYPNNTVAGVNDYSYYDQNQPYSGTLFTVASDPTIPPLTILAYDILSNDYGNPDQIKCLEIVSGPLGSTIPAQLGSIAGSTSTSVVFNPPNYSYGIFTLRYKPYNSSTNTYGSPAYIFIRVEAGTFPCNNVNNPNQCNLVCNGDFEYLACSTCTNKYQLFHSINNFTLTSTYGIFGNTPDVLGFAPNNGAFLRLINNAGWGSEGIYLPLSDEIDIGCTVEISFDASTLNNASSLNAPLTILGTNSAPCPIDFGPTGTPLSAGSNGSSGTTSQCPTFTTLNPEMVNIPITNSSLINGAINMPYNINPQFQNYTVSFFNNTGQIIDGILITPGNTSGGVGIFIDNIEVINLCIPQININPTVVTPNPCIGNPVIIEYEVCISGGTNTSDITLASSFSPQDFNLGNGGDFNNLGQAVIPAGTLTAASPCTTLTLILDILPTAIAGVPSPVDINWSSSNVCANSTIGNTTIDVTPSLSNILTITKTASPGPFVVGDNVTYLITVENTSLTSTVNNIIIEDILSPNLSVLFLPAILQLSGSTLTSSNFSLAPGQSTSFQFNANISPNMNCGTINNCASIISADGVCNLPSSDCESIYVYSNNPSPQVSNDVTYCFGETMADLTAPPLSNGTIIWFYDNGGGTSYSYLGSGSVLQPPYTNIGTHTYIVMEMVGGFSGCASVPDTVTITILPSGWPELAGNNLNVDEQGEDVQVDAFGNVYVTGSCGMSAVFGQGSNQETIDGDGFVAKYDACGVLLWINPIRKAGKSLVLDKNQENVIVTGGGTDRAFLNSYNQNGFLNWQEIIYTGSPGSEVSGVSIDIDENDQIYFTGFYTRSIHFGTYLGTPYLGANNLAQHGFVATYDINGQYIIAVNLEMATPSGTIIPRGIAVTSSSLPLEVYVGGSYSGNAYFSGSTLNLNGSGEFIVKLSSSNLSGLLVSDVTTSVGSAISPLSELDWHDFDETLLATGGSMVAGFSPMLTPSWNFISPTSTFVDLDYVELNGALYLSGQDNTTQAALVAKIKPAVGFNWFSTAQNPAGPDITKGVASNGVFYGGNNRTVHATGGFVDKISFPSVLQSYIANGNTSDIFVAKVTDNNSYGTFKRSEFDNLPENNNNDDVEINIYPNPFTETFWVDLSKIDEKEIVSIKVFDLAGKLILIKENVTGGSLTKLDMFSVAKGFYLVRVNLKNKSFIQELIKQ
jgi:uncharacterized repeat protein (TIGR01451 family)